MVITIQVTGKLKSNVNKQTVTGVAIEGSGEFFYSLIFLEGDSLLFLSKKMRFFYIPKRLDFFLFVETYILTFVQPCFSLGGPPPTTSATRPVEGGFEKVKVVLYLIFSETVNVDQVKCGKVIFWYLDLKSIPPPYDNRRSSLARWQWASWRTAVPSQRWDWNTWQLLTWEVLVYVQRTCCICMCVLFVRFL